ncbi:MAG: radical SAM protein [Actinobacteria bacterium]|nr:radical SAM protein [Actinomycetota bacterium]MBU1942701.1 radical SAM protein [Actinomycetota bacterium]MBU2686023.1 radical SAM protein [Actinomycetota bacterium]
MDGPSPDMEVRRPPMRRFRRFFYRNLGPPRMPGAFSLGCFLVERFPRRIPFTKFSSPDHYTFYIPRFGTRAYGSVLKGGLLRDFHLGGGPAAVTLAVTSRCPCSCYHCSAYRRSQDGEMDTATVKRVISECADLMMGSIVLTGGEPMMRGDLPELVAHVQRCETTPQIFTSGYFMDRDSVRELADAGLEVVFVSLDSPIASEHDGGRGVEGLFDKACRGLRYSSEAGIHTGISTFATHEGVAGRYVERFYNLGCELDVREITVFDVTPTGRMMDREDLLLTPEEHRHLSGLQEGQFARRRGPKIVTMSYVNETDIIGCFGAKYQLHITHDGFVTPCDFTPLHFGNVGDEPLRTIWNRMTAHPEYRKKTVTCRMQDPEFRRRYIRKIPADAPLPYPMDRIPMETF